VGWHREALIFLSEENREEDAACLQEVSRKPWSGVIAFFVDTHYLYPCLIAIFSASQAASKNVRFVVGTFYGELGEQERASLSRLEIVIERPIEIREFRLSDLAGVLAQDDNSHFGLAAFGRVLLASGLPESHFYSDADVIFTSSGGYLESPADGKEVGFVQQKAALRKAGLFCDELNDEFFSGLIYFPEGGPRLTLEELKSNLGSTPFSSHDQAVLNRVYAHNYRQISVDYCQLDNPRLRVGSIRNGIVHYFGNWKPWHAPASARERCTEVGCAWSAWFAMEKKFLDSFGHLESGKLSRLQELSMSKASPKLTLLFRLSAGRANLLGRFFLRPVFRVLMRAEMHTIH
jgi:lipopolysaccharide biosynthesis glycosyltransferase